MAKKIIIYNHWGYYGGTLVLSVLCKTLREIGYDARIFFVNPHFCSGGKHFRKQERNMYYALFKKYVKLSCNKILNKHFNCDIPQTPVTTMSGIKIQHNPFYNRNKAIVLYPEFTYGNPLYARDVVRWFLFYNRFRPEDNAYGKKDLFIAYREIFNDITLNPEQHIINIKYFDSTLYRQYNFKERKGNCYILRKGKNRTDIPSSFDGPCFDDNMSQEDLVKIFNEHKYCYSYDTQTFYSSIAAVCGCIPIVMLEPDKTIDDYLNEEERSKHYGVAYGNTPDQIEYAIKTRGQLLESLDFDEINRLNALKFVEIVERRFGEIKKL
ncbi:MAG: hypothetical protein IIU87_04385 [Prevotella sp.]|nr:hypothetical protein [Prevotella sp.]